MTSDDWKSCKVIQLNSRDDKHNWGEIGKIDRSVIKTLDMFASSTGNRVRVTCGSGGKHVDGSYHYPTASRLGVALDFMLPNLKRRELPDVLIHLLKFPFGGIGIYSEWKLSPELPCIGGFHVDMRPQSVKALWLKGSEGGYQGVTLANLRKWFV